MNTAKIAGLYAASHYATHQRLAGTAGFSPQELTQRLRRLVYHDDTSLTADDELAWRYHVSVSDGSAGTSRRLDFFGERQYARTESYVTPRVFAWAGRQLPAEDDRQAPDRCVVTLAAYPPRQDGADSQFELRLCGLASLAQMERGIRAYQRKRQRYVRKLLAQLTAYHAQQVTAAQAKELRDLQRGYWLGAEKALTTAARVNEPGVGFLGDANLSDEQRRTLDLHYWAVPADMGMSAAFPAGTGLALRPVKRSRDLVDGAVYLFYYQLTEDYPLKTLGRLDLSRKSYGMLPLFHDEAPDNRILTWAAWSDPKFHLYRVSHYTTRAAGQPAAAGCVMQLEVLAEVAHDELALAA